VATIQITPRFEEWVQEKVVKSFELKGIKVTPTAQLGLAFLSRVGPDPNAPAGPLRLR
jgi:hypothetical protein